MTPRLDHGVIGNGRVLALVAPTSAIEWLCLPRFDSPSLFGRILDHDAGGTFRILAGDEEVTGALRYLPNTNVLATRFERGDDAWEVIDFAPRIPRGVGVDAPHELVRIIRPIRGLPRLAIDFDPRPDYGRRRPALRRDGDAITVEGEPLRLFSSVPVDHVLGRTTFTLRQPQYLVLSYGGRGLAPTPAELDLALDETVAGWRAWARTCAVPTFAGEAVLRSALCLKLHAYQDTGAIIAAATTSIPEALGTQRTWDYRYCWLRDAAFVVEALRRLSHLTEGERFIRFLRDVAEQGPLQPLYGIAGERELPESFLPHLAGFAGNGFVRIGNAAATQVQNDLYGELVLCLQTLLTDPRLIVDDAASFEPLIARLVEQAEAAAPLPDTGIWEFRSMLRPYTFSRAMCWAAIDRGALLARRFGWDGRAERWARVAAAEREVVLRRGFASARGFFTQALDGEHPDAANLLLPTLGLIDARDPRFLATLDAYGARLARDGLMLRYVNDDDFGETTSAFTICSFWWAEALALAGRLDEAVAVFQRVSRHANPLGLFSEDIDPATGALLGNFPQAYTHVGLIHAALTIDALQDARDGRCRAWA